VTWVIPHFRWTNKVLYVRRLNKEQNERLYYITICALVLWELFVTSHKQGCDKNSHSFLCLINVLCVCCRLTMMAKNNIWECTDHGARGGTQLEVECLKGYGGLNKFGNHCFTAYCFISNLFQTKYEHNSIQLQYIFMFHGLLTCEYLMPVFVQCSLRFHWTKCWIWIGISLF
jgi:hypothetical protein